MINSQPHCHLIVILGVTGGLGYGIQEEEFCQRNGSQSEVPGQQG